MSRITDYILEPNVVYTNGAFLIKVKVQDSYKYKKYLVSEDIKYTTVNGTTFTLTNVKNGQPASILQLQGNTTQNGTPTPTNPIPIYTVSGDNEVVVSNKNLFDNNFANYILTGGNYGYKQVTDENEPLILSIKDKDTSISLSGVYFGFSGTGINASQGVSWIINNGTAQATATNILSGNRYLKYISFYPKNETTFNKIISRYDIQLEKGTVATDYIEHKGSSYRVDLRW